MPLRNLLVISLATIVSIACFATASKNRYANLFAEALHLVETQALHEVPTKQLFKSAMDGMLSQLDEHSLYMDGDDFRAIDEDMNQLFGGVGMYVDTEPETNRLIVLAPIPDTPAYRAGVQVGDEITEIDGKSTKGMKQNDAINLMRGDQGSEVVVVFKRGDELIPIPLIREAIPVPSVQGDHRDKNGNWKYTLEDMPNVGYIRLLQFGKKSTQEITAVLEEIGGKVDGVILDLRNNTGGLLNAATEICDLFLEKGLSIVQTRGRNRKLNEEHFSRTGPAFNKDIPLVILVNRHSASASEVVAGCLQDHGRAIVIGEQSWGKGTVQNLIPMQQNESALKLTVASFWRPSGRNIDRSDPEAKRTKVWGIQPNEGFEIDLTEEEVFANIRSRNERVLNDLRQNSSQVNSGTANDTPNPDTPKPAPENEQPQGVDRPLERARQFFRTLFSKSKAA